MATKKTAKQNDVVEIKRLQTETILIKLVGDSDLILNKKTASTERELTADDRKKAHQEEAALRELYPWEDAITALHWRDPLGFKSIDEYTEEAFNELMASNAPCISAHGLKESWKSAVVRIGLDQYSTKFDFQVNIKHLDLVPITFASYTRDIKSMPQKGRGGGMLTAKLHRFSGWEAIVPVTYIVGGVYKLDTILSVIENAGFGLGIGSGTKSGYGRYHIENVEG